MKVQDSGKFSQPVTLSTAPPKSCGTMNVTSSARYHQKDRKIYGNLWNYIVSYRKRCRSQSRNFGHLLQNRNCLPFLNSNVRTGYDRKEWEELQNEGCQCDERIYF